MELFEKEKERRGRCAFRMAEIRLKKRSASQCRSHFQKLQKKYGTLEDIITHFIQADSEDNIANKDVKNK